MEIQAKLFTLQIEHLCEVQRGIKKQAPTLLDLEKLMGYASIWHNCNIIRLSGIMKMDKSVRKHIFLNQILLSQLYAALTSYSETGTCSLSGY